MLRRRKASWTQPLGVGLANAAGVATFAAKGGVNGPVAINARGEKLVKPAEVGQPFEILAQLDGNMQSLVGRDGYVKSLNVDLTAVGPTPPTFATREAFYDYLFEGCVLEVRLGTPQASTIQAIYSAEQVKDTRFMQRQLSIEIDPDIGRFEGVVFIWRKPGATFIDHPLLPYTVQLNVMTYWGRRT